MEKNLYYRAVLRRPNIIKEALFAFFLSLASYPRLLLEVFVRKNFGERYFRFSTVILTSIFLIIIPFVLNKLFSPIGVRPHQAYYQGDRDVSAPASPFSMAHFITWYIFIAAFIYVSYLRKLEIKRNPSVFDFARYSLFSGTINPMFLKLSFSQRQTDTRLIETVLEPAFFFIIGFLLCLFQQWIGLLIILCSIVYAGSYFASYHVGDNFVMDKIDEMICNAELKKAFVNDLNADETRGFRFIGRKPADIEKRKQMLPFMTQDHEVFEVL